ncbi:hypothetical protein JQ633_01905 [Bradyrhizobium tropiciagri]|uniref:STM3941 family protein n=1 Tax=Bradyrhizobium tropiciagri TaxID=312253 RepID=UPI001BA9C495|nr:STM3941 family protein [Bradyrhizobium tropiciagri]MBR0869095.1 hypothetical protein [Bradyrhizobium tropiciagri]
MLRTTNVDHDLPDIEISYSWSWNLAQLFVYLLLFLLCLASVLGWAPQKAMTTTKMTLAYTVTALLGFAVCYQIPILLWPQWPVVFVNRFGIRDKRVSKSTIPWQSIEAVSLRAFRGHKYLELTLDPAVARLLFAKKLNPLPALLNKLLGTRGVVINTMGLKMEADEVFDLCKRYRAAAVGSSTLLWR